MERKFRRRAGSRVTARRRDVDVRALKAGKMNSGNVLTLTSRIYDRVRGRSKETEGLNLTLTLIPNRQRTEKNTARSKDREGERGKGMGGGLLELDRWSPVARVTLTLIE